MSSLLTNNEITIANTNLSDRLAASSGKGLVCGYSPKRSNPDFIAVVGPQRNRK